MCGLGAWETVTGAGPVQGVTRSQVLAASQQRQDAGCLSVISRWTPGTR